jgi:hypothetical protein
MAEQSFQTDNHDVMAMHVAWQMAQRVVAAAPAAAGDAEQVSELLRSEYTKCYQAVKASYDEAHPPRKGSSFQGT